MTLTKELKMRKKFLALLILLFLVVTLSGTGCGRKESSKDEKPTTSAEKKKEKKKEEKEPGVVTLSSEKQKASGIEVQKVVPESVSVPLSATAVIELNADRVSKVGSRVTGKITRVTASTGDRVKARQELSEVEADLALSKEKFRLLGIDLLQMELGRNGGKNEHPFIPISSAIDAV